MVFHRVVYHYALIPFHLGIFQLRSSGGSYFNNIRLEQSLALLVSPDFKPFKIYENVIETKSEIIKEGLAPFLPQAKG
jgi:hypothetical protein